MCVWPILGIMYYNTSYCLDAPDMYYALLNDSMMTSDKEESKIKGREKENWT